MKTRITELLGIDHPIIQAGMNYGAYPSLVAAVSNAGGLGILGAGSMTADELRQNIRMIKGMTNRPFGVNLLATSPILNELIEVMIEEKIPLASYGRGDPKMIVERTRPYGILNVPTVGAVRHALSVEEYGADAIIIQGMEGGGHTSYISTLVLLPQVANSVKIPVIAAGGFCDGQGLVAALALGAEGISMGTRFALTQESAIPDSIKQFYLNSGGDDAVITTRVTGTRCRGLENKLVKTVESERRGLALKEWVSSLLELRRAFNVPLWQVISSGLRMKKAYEMPVGQLGNAAAGNQRIKKALVDGDSEWGFMPCGQVSARIDDIPSCKELIERIVKEADATISGLRRVRE
jgi:NAD(P)H-dependent flavin oxidoreductase YrpB (nitropropane dioxygenase family)